MQEEPVQKHQQYLTDEFAAAAEADKSARQNYGWLWKAETGQGKAPAVWRGIGECSRRIHAKFTELGFPSQDHRVRHVDNLIDRRYHILRMDEGIQDPQTLERFQAIRRELLLLELSLDVEPSFDPHEDTSVGLKRLEENVQEAGRNPAPFLLHLAALDSVPPRAE